MIHAYDSIYLSKAQNSLAAMFDFAVNDLQESLDDFYKKFLMSKIAAQFEQGVSAVIAGKSGIELALEVLGDFSLAEKYRPAVDRSPEYWTGWALAYFQWYANLTFKQIDALIPITEVWGMYAPYHEMDITQFCDAMLERYNARKGDTNLKRLRLAAGLSQSVLAQITGISVRTIQQYEQRQKHINAAKAETVIMLAKALACPVDALLEV